MGYTLQKLFPKKQFSWNIIQFCKFVHLLRLSCQNLSLLSWITEPTCSLKKLCAWRDTFLSLRTEISPLSLYSMQKQVHSSPLHLELQSLREVKWNNCRVTCSNIKWLQSQKLQTCWRRRACTSQLSKLSFLKVSGCPDRVYCFLLL